MSAQTGYSQLEKAVLIAVGLLGIVAINGVFVYALFVRPEWIADAQSNPVSAVFIAEALVLMLVFTWLLTKWGVSRLHWAWFIVLSLLGSMAFALPVVLLWPRRGQGAARQRGRTGESAG